MTPEKLVEFVVRYNGIVALGRLLEQKETRVNDDVQFFINQVGELVRDLMLESGAVKENDTHK